MELPEVDLGPFATLYEEWTSSYPEPRDPQIEARLAALYRDVWKSGEPREQVYVTFFVYDRKDPKDADILIEAIQSPYYDVAKHAAATLQVWLSTRHALLQHSEEILNAFRVLVLQHPVEDLIRFGELRRADGWPEGRAFVQLYERWMCDDFPRDHDIDEELNSSVPDTWTHGDAVDRAFVLHYLSASRRLEGKLDLIVEGLRSRDIQLGRAAAFYAWNAIRDGRDLGPGIREILEDHRDRFPEFGGYAWAALHDLDPDNSPPSGPRSYQNRSSPGS